MFYLHLLHTFCLFLINVLNALVILHFQTTKNTPPLLLTFHYLFLFHLFLMLNFTTFLLFFVTNLY